MNPYLIIGALLALAAAFSSGWWTGSKVNEANWQARELALKEASDALREGRDRDRDQISKELAEGIAKIQVVNRTVNQKVIHEIQKEPVYLRADCAIPVGGVRLINETRGYSVQGGPSGPPSVSPPSPAPGPTPSSRGRIAGDDRLVCRVPGVRCTS